ncbi:MAG TPA: 4Fe-4S dicluster domain-containing protein [Euryarchaeota archaeon]|nr:4Fe-4S dicluster domain-containing protein [Euryarchaeota archaeon]
MGNFTLKIDEELCQGCGNCIVVCPVSAFSDNNVAGGSGSDEQRNFGVITGAVKIYDPEFCTGCGTCVNACGYGAIKIEVRGQQKLEVKLSADNLWMTGEKAIVYDIIKKEGPLSIEQIIEKLEIPNRLALNLIFTLKNENKIFEAGKIEEDHRVGYIYTSEPPMTEEKEKEVEEVAEITVDPEKAEKLRKTLESMIDRFNTVKIRFMLEAGKLDRVKEELVAKLEER